MAFVVETGYGTPGANSLASVEFADAYLAERGRSEENDWSGLQTADKRVALIRGTDHIATEWGPIFKGEPMHRLIAGRAASARLTIGGVPSSGETVTVGAKAYRFVAALVQEDDVLIGATVAETWANLITALDGGGLGSTVHEDTLPNYEATAVVNPDGSLGAYARQAGEAGNSIAFATTIAGATITGAGFLVDGLDEGPQPLPFPRRNLYTRAGALVVGVPLNARKACVEYGVRSLAASLLPDPTVDDSLRPVVRYRIKLDEIEEETQYADGGAAVTTLSYPAADRLLAEYALSGGRTVSG